MLKIQELLVLFIIYNLSLCNLVILQHKITIVLLLFVLTLLVDLLNNIVFDIAI